MRNKPIRIKCVPFANACEKGGAIMFVRVEKGLPLRPLCRTCCEFMSRLFGKEHAVISVSLEDGFGEWVAQKVHES